MKPLPAVSAVAAARAVAQVRTGVDPRALRDDTPAPFMADASTELSGAARLLEALLSLRADDHPTLPMRPLLPAPPSAAPAATAQLAAALQQGLEQSGLFYESHLASWLHGELPAAALRAEPQGQLPALPAPAAGGPATVLAEANGAHAPVAAGELPTALAGVVDARAGGIVQQQLIALDTQVLPWQGQVWPGQTLAWTLAPAVDPEQPRSGAHEAPRAWSSRLQLALPGLGTVEAELQWAARGCQLTVRAPDTQLARLRAALPALARALEGAGIRTERIVVGALPDSSHA